jgi:hypothetical protein
MDRSFRLTWWMPTLWAHESQTYCGAQTQREVPLMERASCFGRGNHGRFSYDRVPVAMELWRSAERSLAVDPLTLQEAGPMRTLKFCRFALGICAVAAMLGGCGSRSGNGAVLPSNGALVPPIGIDKASSRHRSFYYTGREQHFRVPPGVKWVGVVARGGGGAAGGGSYDVSGGRGGRVHAFIPVTPGETLGIYVGGEGSGMSGGFNGGGDGGQKYYCNCPGAGGGGSSDVRQGGDGLGDRVLVVGGGGGAGGGSFENALAGIGGKGGGSKGGSGGSGAGSTSGGQSAGGGSGGAQSAGGSGGTGSSCDSSYSGNPGANGTLLDGGAGGQGGPYYGTGAGGGGGGGGYYGGGGGGAGSSAYTRYCHLPGGGGGGGSSYIEPSAKSFRGWQGWKNAVGNGLVVISWQ